MNPIASSSSSSLAPSTTTYPPRSESPPHHTIGRDSQEEEEEQDDSKTLFDHDREDEMKIKGPQRASSMSSSLPVSTSTHHRNGLTQASYQDHPGLSTPNRILTSASQMFRPPHIDPQELSRELLQTNRKIKTKDDVFKHGLIVLGLICSWYFFSTCISVYNKWMFDPSKHNFPFPVFVTSMHMFVQTGLALLAVLLLDKTGKMELIPRKPNGSKRRPSGQDWIGKVFPCALASALDVGLSNNSLKSITLTLYTMCKSSTLVFILVFAFLFRLEKVRCNLIAIIAVITVGVIMMVAAETQLVVLGAIQVLSASVMGGLKGAMTQLLLEKEKLGLTNPISMILWICPIMGTLLLLSSPLIESWKDLFENEYFNSGLLSIFKIFLLLLLPGVLAFFMMLSEYTLIKRTSIITLSIAGIFKEVLTVILASFIFHDKLTAVNVTGLIIALIGIGAYNWIKWKGLNDDDEQTDQEGYERVQEQLDEEEQEPLSIQEEEERRRKRIEEADMDGWEHSGIQQVGGGY
ncbi:unnamed protein product [Sympodiomycopsis kandeliae]